MITFFSSPKSFYKTFLGACFLSIGILWNPESGLIPFVAWSLTVSFLILFQTKNYLTSLTKVIASISSGLLLTAIGFIVYQKLRFGEFPDLTRLVEYHKIFNTLLFINLETPSLHAWHFVMVPYFAGLALCIMRFWDRFTKKIHVDSNDIRRDSLLLYLCLLGIGEFVYYQTKTHDVDLIGPGIYSFLVMGFLLDRIFSLARTEKKIFIGLLPLALGMTAYLCLFSGYLLKRTEPKIFHSVKAKFLHHSVPDIDSYFVQDSNFIRQKMGRRENPLILSHYEPVYNAALGYHCPVQVNRPFGLIFTEEADQIIKFLKSNNDAPVFMASDWKSNELPLFGPLYCEVLKVLFNQYVFYGTSPTNALLYFEKKSHFSNLTQEKQAMHDAEKNKILKNITSDCPVDTL